MKLHLGCWTRYIEGYVHVDLCDLPHIDYKSSIDSLPFIHTNSVDTIYCSHAFEYFDRQMAPLVLREWRRVLKPGGILRLSVPDFAALIKVYEATNDINKVLGPLFGRMEVANVDPIQIIYHKTVYDFNSMFALLESEGFVNINRYDWRDTEHSAIDDHSQAYFPHMDKENGLSISLNIESKKASI